MTDEHGRQPRRPFCRPPAPLWGRPDAHLWIRPDADRFMPPGWRDQEPYASLALYGGRAWAPAAKTPAPPPQARGFTEAERRLLLRMLDDSRAIAAELRAMREALEDKAGFNPSQPRVPAGNPDGGRWTGAGGGGAAPLMRLIRLADASNVLGPGVMSDASPDPVVAGAQYAENDKPGYPVDLTDDEQLGGHAIREHVAKSDSYLANRVREEANKIVDRGDDFRGLGITSFTSVDAANKLVNSTISQNQITVDQVARGIRSKAFLTARFSTATGYESYLSRLHATPYRRETYGVGVYVVHDQRSQKGFRVQSAYPTR